MNELLWWFGQNTLAALLMIPCVMLSCRLFRDRPAVQHLLWLVILLKFVTPPVVVWPWSIDELRSMAWPRESNVQVATLEPSAVSVASGRRDSQRLEATDAFLGEFAPILEPQTTSHVQWSSILAFASITVALVGAIVCFVSQLRRMVRYARLVRSGSIAPLHLKAEVASVASLLRMKAPVSVVVKGIASPFLLSVGTTRLAWPDSISSRAHVVRSRGIIAHELAHLHRRDHWIAWLELGASILWWWNPLFWFVRRQLRETAEMSCDALAIAVNPESRHSYAELLLQYSSQTSNGVPAYVLAVGAGNVASFERRLKMILSSNVTGNLSWSGALAIAFLAVIALPYWSLAQSSNYEPNLLPIALSDGKDTPKDTPKDTSKEAEAEPMTAPPKDLPVRIRFVTISLTELAKFEVKWLFAAATDDLTIKNVDAQTSQTPAPALVVSSPNIEKYSPVQYAILSEAEANAILEEAGKTRKNVLNVPTLVVPNGQHAGAHDVIKTSHTNRSQGRQIVESGLKVDVCPSLDSNSLGTLNCALTIVEKNFCCALDVPIKQTLVFRRMNEQTNTPKLIMISNEPDWKPVFSEATIAFHQQIGKATSKLGKPVGDRVHPVKILGPIESEYHDWMDPPSDDEIIHALAKTRPQNRESTELDSEKIRLRIAKEKTHEFIEPSRFVPLIGFASIHHVFYKCKISIAYPKSLTADNEEADHEEAEEEHLLYVDHYRFTTVIE